MSSKDTIYPGDPNGPVIPLFVYGTLRPGGALDEMLEPVVEGSVRDVQVQGLALYHVIDPKRGKKPLYPVAVPQPGATARGDLLFCRPGPRLFDVFRMEIGAGYGLSRVRVGGFKVGDGATFGALGVQDGTRAWAFVYPKGVKHGSRVANDDWATQDQNIARRASSNPC